MNTWPWWIWLLVAYLLGSVPVGWLVGRGHGVDLRRVGSGNIGATNVWRTLGRPWGLFTFVLDFVKGALPVWVATAGAVEQQAWLPALCGLLADGGHIFPAALGFRGGKGVATGGGVLVALTPWAAAIALLTWLLFFYTFRYVSLASLAAALAAGATGCLAYTGGPRVVLLVLAALIIIRHRANVRRLLRGQEPRALRKKTGIQEASPVCPQ
ncbi:MAG: glycerol-3-phosphate 1-O-acyltransferase PlsY [Candidatus Marinimicrobia bacterium]|nr:glycerol-3-phosphate 1-O-acyltransferase PlsY [Candidatus Neomarinimicrobiota bacterium]